MFIFYYMYYTLFRRRNRNGDMKHLMLKEVSIARVPGRHSLLSSYDRGSNNVVVFFKIIPIPIAKMYKFPHYDARACTDFY